MLNLNIEYNKNKTIKWTIPEEKKNNMLKK